MIGSDEEGTFRTGPKIKIEGADDRASLHVNNIPYEATFSEVDAGPGIYPIYDGVLSTGLSGFASTSRVFDFRPSDKKFDWTFRIKPVEKSCDNCGAPMINVYEWRD